MSEAIQLLDEEIEAAIAARVPHSRIRALRIKRAKLKGNHTKEQWEALKEEFDQRCVKCGAAGLHLDKDHIIPVYQGGSDGLDNIQPLCAWCNAGKSAETNDWAAYRRVVGFDE